jgi:hypothetical protein
VRTLPTLVLATLLLALAAGRADAQDVPREFWGHHRQATPVVVVRGLTLADLPELAPNGAVGLMVPSAGPRTSEGLAFAGIVRGVLHNGRLGARPKGPVLIHVEKSRSIPLTSNVIVIGLPPGQTTANARRYPIAVFNACRGVLLSSLTRVAGLVSAADVARTALSSPHALGCRRDANAVATLTRLEQRIEVARGTTMIGTVVVLGLLIAFALLLPAATLPALASALAVNLGLGWVPAGGAEARLTLLGLCVLVGGVLGRKLVRRPVLVALGLTAVVAAYGVAMAVQPGALSLAPLGPELTSRFYGISNLLETLLLVPTLVAAAVLGRSYGTTAFAAVATLALATIAENRLGADGGGAVVLGVAFAILAVGMLRARPWMAVPALGIAALVVLALLNVDAATSSPDHLRGALSGGAGGLANVVAHRVPLSYARVAEQWYLVFPLLALAALIVRSRRWPATRDRRALVTAFAAAVIASLLVNDSPGPVTLAALASFFALEPLAVRRELDLAAARFLPPAPAPAPAIVRAERP